MFCAANIVLMNSCMLVRALCMVTRVVKVRGAVESLREKGWKDQRMEDGGKEWK